MQYIEYYSHWKYSKLWIISVLIKESDYNING